VSFTVAEVTDRVKQSFGDDSGVQLTDAQLIRWVNDGLLEVAESIDIFQKRVAVTTTPNQAGYSIPANLIRIEALNLNDTPLKVMSRAQANEYIEKAEANDSTLADTPRVYWVWGNEIFLYPTPSTTDTLHLFYVSTPTTITSNADSIPLPDTYRNRLVEFCLRQAYEMDENFEASQLKEQQFRGALNGMRSNTDTPRSDFYDQITYLPEEDRYYPYDSTGVC
jgi:hypothetical protein